MRPDRRKIGAAFGVVVQTIQRSFRFVRTKTLQPAWSHSKTIAGSGARPVVSFTKFIHHHVAVRPHAKLMDRGGWYAKWHGWKWHPFVHVGVLLLFVTGSSLVTFRAFGSGDTNVWTFNTPGEYTYTNGKIEPNSNNLRLSLNDTVKNFTVAGGQLQSNNVLDVTADDTYYYVSTDLGIDVIRQDTWVRSAYVTSGGGFTSLALSSGYLYAGKNGGIYRWQTSALANNTAPGSARYTTATSPALGNQNILRLSAIEIANKVYVVSSTLTMAQIIKDELGTPTIVKATIAGGFTNNSAVLTSDGSLYYDMRINGGSNTDGAILVKYNAIAQVADWNWSGASVDYGSDWAPLHGTDIPRRTFTGLKVTEGTSTANSGNNTIFVETEDGLVVVQENRTTPLSSTVNTFTHTAKGPNLITGSTAQGRFDTSAIAANTVDGNSSTYYRAQQTLAEDWLEYDLGTSKTFNYLKQLFWYSPTYHPSSYVIESSTQGTSANLSPGATGRGQWPNPSYPSANAIDGNFGSTYYTNFASTVVDPLYEIDYASPQQVSGVDLQFYDQNSVGKNYVLEGSSTITTPIAVTAATSSSILNNDTANFGPLKAIDNNSGSRWISNVATNTAPQWLQLDLGSSQTIAGLGWVSESGNYTKDYSIDYSTDGTNWTSAYATTNSNTSTGYRAKFSSPVTGRYVRLYVTQSGNGADIQATRVAEIEPYSSMFESGTVNTLATVTNNTSLGKFSDFATTTVKAIRVRVSATHLSGSNFGIKEMKTFQTTFTGGTVSQLKSISGLALVIGNWTSSVAHDTSFASKTARFLRVRYTGYSVSGLITSEVELNNTSLPENVPTQIKSSTLDVANNRYYSVHNSSAPEDGRVIRIDGVNVNAPVVGEVINKANKSDLISDEFSAVKYVDSNRFLAGTAAGASFIGKRYATDLPTIEPNSPYSPAAVSSWKTFTESATKNGGEIYYQISNDGGSTWQYWNGAAWVDVSGATYNTATDINANISTFPVGTRNFKWRAFLSSNGSQAITLTSVTLVINPDVTPPASNASAIQMFRSSGGAVISNNAWVNTPTPYFSWTAGTDDTNPGATGIKGYCLYLGQDNTADPQSTKGLLGASPLNTDGACAFAVSATNINLATANMLGASLSSSSTPYYLRIKALDYSNNVFTGSATSFQFRYDNTAPASPGFISGPSQFIATRDVTLTWPSSGTGSISDANSGVLGLQYKINDSTWYGASHNGAQDETDLLSNSGSYRTDATFDYPNLIEGNNIVAFRTLDAAGNFSTTYATAVIKINTDSPSSPLSVQATPSTNTQNSFAFSWSPPASFVGSAGGLQYCYTVNTLPTINTCTFTTAGVTNVAAGPYATQPGQNTFYVVAKDEAGNVNYDTYASTTFTANTAAPGLPLDLEIADISTKATLNWKVAVSWAPPADVGAGVSSYRIYRSTNNSTFTQVASTAGASYVDANLSQQVYYYRVRACDSANNCGANSSVVSMLPTGKFTEPAALVSTPTVTNITTKRAVISWSTNRESDSKIAIGKAAGQYSPSEISSSAQVTSHVVSLDNLDAGTTYYMLARWTDEDGNTGVSDEFSFQTAPAPVLKEVNTLKAGLTNAIIQFTVKDATKVDLNFGKSEDFGGVKTTNTSASESTYEVELAGLDDGVKYFYKITMYDSEGGKYQSSIFSLTTLPRPRISQLTFQPVEGEPTSTQKVSWTTNVPATSQLSYSRDGQTPKEVSDSKLLTDHEIVIRDLEDSSTYSLVALSRDAAGNLATSDRQSFKTALDTRPPKILDISVEKVVRGSGSEARGQIVVTWKTDEPSTSQVQYAEGASATELNNQSIEDGNLTTEHVAIISDLSPSKAYNVRPVSRDKGNNLGVGGSQSIIIGRATDSVISIIFNTLQRMFGFNTQ